MKRPPTARTRSDDVLTNVAWTGGQASPPSFLESRPDAPKHDPGSPPDLTPSSPAHRAIEAYVTPAAEVQHRMDGEARFGGLSSWFPPVRRLLPCRRFDDARERRRDPGNPPANPSQGRAGEGFSRISTTVGATAALLLPVVAIRLGVIGWRRRPRTHVQIPKRSAATCSGALSANPGHASS